MGLNLTVSLVVSAALIVAQMILTDGQLLLLWGNWLSAGVLSGCLWYVIGHSHLGSITESKVLAVVWPMLSITLNFCYLYFPTNPISPVQGQLLLLGQLCSVALVLLMWQGRQSPLQSLGTGILLGLTSAVYPQALLWLLLVPLLLYHMRATSSRNGLSILTGTLLGIWLFYCYTLIEHPADAGQVLLTHYLNLLSPGPYVSVLASFSLWQWLYMAVLVMAALLFSITTITFGTGHTMRSRASLMLLCTLVIACIALLPVTPSLIPHYLCQLALLLSILHVGILANVRSTSHEWWILLTQLLCVAVSVLAIIL